MKTMMHNIRYVGLAGEINFSKEPYMYQDTDLFNYNLEYDINYFPSGRGGKVKRFKQWPQVSTLTLGVINRVDVRELVADLERHFQVDINAKKPAKLYVNGSYTECYIVSSVKTFFNRFKGINFVTFDILRENPVWITDEEFTYIRNDLEIDMYADNLIKPPYDFHQFEFTQPARRLEEANLIEDGWDSFEPYGNEGKETRAPLEVFEDGYVKNILPKKFEEFIREISPENNYISNSYDVSSYKGDSVSITSKYGSKTTYSEVSVGLYNLTTYQWVKEPTIYPIIDGVMVSGLFEVPNDSDKYAIYEYFGRSGHTGGQTGHIIDRGVFLNGTTYKIYDRWEDIPEEDKPVRAWDNMAVHFTPLGNGLTRIQTWGGNSNLKLRFRLMQDLVETNTSLYIINKGERMKISRWVGSNSQQFIDSGEEKFVSFNQKATIENTTLGIDTDKVDYNLDFIASEPVILENDNSIVYDMEETSLGKYRLRTYLSNEKTKLIYKVPKSVFMNEEYTHSLLAENLGHNNLIIKSEDGLYENDPYAVLNPKEHKNMKFTGKVTKENLYTTFEIGTEQAEDNMDVIISKPAIKEGTEPFTWPSDEEIVSLRIPTPIPFWITADDSIKYISNNSIGETLAKITIFGAIKEPTLYIGDNTYRIHEELLENERIEIDQRNKTIIKITGSGERVNVFHLRDKEHSVFKPIPEGENSITQNDDFSYTIVLYHERNEPKWT